MNFREYQTAFAAHIRNPEQAPCPQGIEQRRMQVYNELLYNNIESFILKCFPVTKQVLNDEQWHTLVRQFFAQHQCDTPYFKEIPAEFIQFLQSEWQAPEPLEYPPFLIELAHYEWLELALYIAHDESHIGLNQQSDLLTTVPVLNPTHCLQAYQYPVHHISPSYQPNESQPVILLVYRDHTEDIQFMELNAVTARLVELLDGKNNGEQAILYLAQEMQHPNPQDLLTFGQQLLNDLRTKGIILGSRQSSG